LSPKKSTFLFAALMVWAPFFLPAADSRLIRRLQAELQEIPYIDTHTHLPDPRQLDEAFRTRRYDVPYVLGASTYVAEFTYGANWEETKKSLAINVQHAYYRPILQAFRDLYGLGAQEELDDSNIQGVSDRMEAAHRKGNVAWFREVLVNRSKLQGLVWLEAGKRGQDEMPDTYFHPMWNTDGFIYLTKTREGKWPLDNLEKTYGVKLAKLGDLETLIDAQVDSFFKRGGVGLKSTTAYYRTLEFATDPSKKRAAASFEKVRRRKDLKPGDQKNLEDYLMLHLLEQTNRLRRPIQYHTGNQQNWNVVANSNPLGLNPLLFGGRFFNTRFVLLHGGYPYLEESVTLARYFPNVVLDLAWMALYSPSAAKREVGDALDMLDGSHVTFGTDCANLEEEYGTIVFTRRILAEVLADKIESGFLTEAAALQWARRILYTNALEIYGLKD
jgi:hypothetical protein